MNRLKGVVAAFRRSPDTLRLAGLSAWRGRERGLAVFAGVFLATLVITTVFAYGAGLSQIFFQESLKNDPYDAKIDLSREPSDNNSGRTNDTVLFESICEELVAMEEIADCGLVFGRQGVRVSGFFDDEFGRAQPLNAISISSPTGDWSNVSFDYSIALENGPPINGDRIIRFMSGGMFDGEFAERHAEQILYGEWPSPESANSSRGVVLPSQLANIAGAKVNDTLESMTFSYVTESASFEKREELGEECTGTIQVSEMGYIYCRHQMLVSNMTVVGIYEEWGFANPTLLFNPIFLSDTILTDSQKVTLMDSDHGYLAVAVDRSQLPTASTDEAAEWLDDLKYEIESKNYTSEELNLDYNDIVSGSITFLSIFLGLIQVFDYIIMIPIVVLSLSVLVYGLILSLEQRRREISINRVMGATEQGLQKMVLVEILVIAVAAWLAGYFLAILTVPLVLDAVGFMSFRSGDFEVDPSLSMLGVFSVALLTIGLAMLFGRNRTKQFLQMEIDEGVKRVVAVKEPKRWLHWTMFFIGLLAMFESWVESRGGFGLLGITEEGVLSNFFIDGLVLLFGPFLLWIGGALVLARIGAAGPRLMRAILGNTPLLKDVRRGLATSGSSESINRLAVIMLLTLSIVTLAAVQGYTGTLVDERTANAQTGSDLQIQFNTPLNQSEALDALKTAVEGAGLEYQEDMAAITTVPVILTTVQEDGTNLLTWVLLDSHSEVLMWDEQAVPGDDITQFKDAIADDWFTAGPLAAKDVNAPNSRDEKGDSAGDWLGDNDETFSVVIEHTKYTINQTDEGEIDPLQQILAAYAIKQAESDRDWSGVQMQGVDLSGSNFGNDDLTSTNFSSVELAGANLSDSLLIFTDLRGANLSGANLSGAVIVTDFSDFFGTQDNLLQGANLSGADLTGAFGSFNLSESTTEGTICPDGIVNDGSGCQSGPIPEDLMIQLAAQSGITVNTTVRNTTIRYAGLHAWVPGLSTAQAEQAIIIGEQTWKNLAGEDAVETLNQTVWFFDIGSLADENDGEFLRKIRVSFEADSRISSAEDWSTTHREVERNGGMIFGTPGLLSLQFVVASLASIASAFVFLSLVLSQRKKDLAILQAIGASPNQVIRLTLFEILSIVLVSMALGILLGVGISYAFNGFFSVFGFIFQIFGGSGTPIDRELVWPWWELLLVNGTVIAVVVLALFFTTRNALKADLATTLKGE